MVRNLKAAEAAGRLTSKLGSYLRPSVLVVDEVGYQPLERAEANLVFQVIFDDDLAGEATRISNRLRGLLTQIHPSLERVLGPRMQHPAVLKLLDQFGSRPRSARQDAAGS